jgi:uncharacterized OsmC-like protein
MTTQHVENIEIRMVNGVAVDSLFDTIDAVKNDPEIAKFNFRISNKWINGAHNHTTIKDFYGAKETHNHKTTFELDADEPPLLLGEGKGPNPVEHLLNALAACVTTSLIYHAAAKGIEVRGVESRLDGDLDLRGFLGLSNEVPVGFQKIRVSFKIDADISDQEKEELIEIGKKYSPVYNTIFAGQTAVTVGLDRG